jgi:hypothetical protein
MGLNGKPPLRRRCGGTWENLLDLSHNFYSIDTIPSYILALLRGFFDEREIV